jgi:hypothetical protein
LLYSPKVALLLAAAAGAVEALALVLRRAAGARGGRVAEVAAACLANLAAEKDAKARPARARPRSPAARRGRARGAGR